MRKDLVRRLEKLEARPVQYDVRAIIWYSNGRELPSVLAPNERIVGDWYIDADYYGDSRHRIREIRKRLTTDPIDHGRNYRRDHTGADFEDCDVERKIVRLGRATLIGALNKADGSVCSSACVFSRLV
jgi:hypothetical protein